MKEVDNTLLKKELVQEHALFALKALGETSDESTVACLVGKINDAVSDNSISNIICALSFVLAQVLEDETSLTKYEKNITLYAFYLSTKSAIQILEDDGEDD